MAGSNEITWRLWEIVQDNDTTTKEKTNPLSCLMHSYNSRFQTGFGLKWSTNLPWVEVVELFTPTIRGCIV